MAQKITFSAVHFYRFLQPTPDYIVLDKKLKKALNELEHFNIGEISKKAILNWLEAHETIYESFEAPPLFFKYEQAFFDAYFDIKKTADLMILDDNASVALREFKTINNINNEQGLLQWLVRYEKMHVQLIMIHQRVVLEKEMTKLLKGFKIYFKTHLLKNCIDFETTFKTHYYDVLNKYEPISKKEREYKIILEQDYMETSSLKYHLEKSGLAF